MEIIEAWITFSILFTIMLATSLFMINQSRKFYTIKIIKQRFSILDLQFPSSAQSLIELITGIDHLPNNEVLKVKKALRAHLYADFLFMPAVYGGLLFVCLKLGFTIKGIGGLFFEGLAYLQLLSWVCDLTENIFLLNRIKNPTVIAENTFMGYKLMQVVKWGFASTAFFSAFSVVLYFWIIGDFHQSTLKYILLVTIELIGFVFINRHLQKKYQL